MKISLDNGILIQNNQHKLLLDPSKKTAGNDKTLVGISHAHSDHIKKHEAVTLSTPETADLMNANEFAEKRKYGKPFEFDGMTIIQRNANHILGSSQFEISDSNETIVYTGDFRMNESKMLGKCEVPECDTLIVESTYGVPSFKFPNFNDVYSEVEKWTKHTLKKGNNVVFGAYALGKSQEAIHMLNEMGFVPVVHPKVAEFSRIYNNHGKNLEFVESGTDEGNKLLANRFVSIMPSNLINYDYLKAMREVTGHKVSASLLTGWGMRFSFQSKGIERVFILSDHADYYQIMDYVEKSKAKKVYTVHGYENELAKNITEKLKIKAKPLKEKSISFLTDFTQ